MSKVFKEIKDLTIDNMHLLFEGGAARNFLGAFLQHVAGNLIWPLDKQECAGMKPPGNFWCSDWWTLETGKYMWIGHDKYMQELPPKRLQRLDFNPYGTIKDGQMKYQTLISLEKLKNSANQLLIPEVGRGLEIVCALLVKTDWDRIICYDVGQYEQFIHSFFSGYFKNKIEYYQMNNHTFKHSKFQELNQDTIFIMSHSRTKAPDALTVYDHPCIKHMVFNGDIIK